MARKRGEKTKPSHHWDKKKGSSYDDGYLSMNNQLAAVGLMLREVPGDGNCLFRALGDQLDGHPRDHLFYRQEVCDFMKQHRDDFEPFVEDDVPFDRHVLNLAQPGTYAGNDAIVAFARLHNVTVVIHQLNAPLWQIHGSENSKSGKELHIAFHNGDHYNSVRRAGDDSETPANIKLGVIPSTAEGYKNGDVDVPVHDPEVLEQQIIEQTGCENLVLIRQSLKNNSYDAVASVDFIEKVLGLDEVPKGLWDDDGTGTRIFGEDVAAPLRNRSLDDKSSSEGVKPKLTAQERMQQKLAEKKHLTNRERKELNRLKKKENQLERHRNNKCVDIDSGTDDELIPVKKLECLSI